MSERIPLAARLAVVIGRIRPRAAGPLAAALFLGAALAYAVSEEAPVGRLEGRIIDQAARTPVARAQVVVTPLDTPGRQAPPVRHVFTGKDGRFILTRIEAGTYQVSASVDTSPVEYAEVAVHEGQTAQVTLALDASRPRLALAGAARHFTTDERAVLPVRGYVEAPDAAGRGAITVSLYRTRLSSLLTDTRTARALARMGGGWGLAGPLPRVLLQPPSGAPPHLLWERRFPITGAGAEGFYNQVLDLDRQEAGTYLVEARYGGATVSTWLVVSDTALVLKSAPGHVLAFVADARTGVPVAASTVRLYRDGRAFAEGSTAQDGIARFVLPGDAGEFHLVAVAQRGGDEAVVGRADYRFEQSGEFTIHAYTDRPIYRPGHRIYYKAIVRRNALQGFGYTVPAGLAVTVEVRDPNGEPVLSERRRTTGTGAVFGHLDLSPEAPTGTYALVLSAGETTATHDIVVASYRKPEFSVTVKPQQPRYHRGDMVAVAVSAQYYFGAPVAGAKVTYTVYRAPDWAAAYRDQLEGTLDEDDEVPEDLYGDGRSVADGEAVLDEQGKAVITFRADAPDDPEAPQDQVFTAQVAVRDAADREVFADGSVRVVGGDFRVAVRTDGHLTSPGAPSQVVLVARDHEQRPLSGVRVELEAAYTRWDPARREHVAEVLALLAATTGADGRAAVTVTFPREGQVHLSARAADGRGRAIRATGWLWVAGEEGGDLQTRYAELSLVADKRRYRAGDTARVLINTDRVGQTLLLTVEGATIYRAITVPVRRRSTVVRVPILERYGPNVFLSALYVRGKRVASSEIALAVAMPEKTLQVTIRSDRSTYGPGDRATYQVEIRDAAGRPAAAEFSLGVVDEAVYALWEDDPRALWNAFYPRRWNAVQTHHSMALWYLGDAEKADVSISLRTRFPDTAYWQPVLRTDAQGKAAVSVVFPDTLTTWRATAVAHTRDTRLGRATHKAVVTKPFFVRVETPRLLTQHDRSRILVLVHNATDAPQEATVRLRVEGLAVEGEETQSRTIPPRGVESVAWPVVARQPGAARVRATAWTGGSGPRLTDGVEVTLPVLPYGRQEITAMAGEVAAGAQRTEVLRLDASAVPESTRLTVRITPSVTSAILGGLDYLIGYPYGCTEQTMSRFLPAVMAQRALRAAGLRDAALEARIPRVVRDGLTRLYRLQHESGGWGWWEFDDGDPWMTAYVLYGLAAARAQGYAVSEGALERGREAALELEKAAAPDTRVFLLYAVALAGDPEAARTRLRQAGLQELGPEGLAYAVLLHRHLGSDWRPASAALGQRAVADDGTIHWQRPQAQRGTWDFENWDDHMATAAALRAVLAVDPRDPRVGPVLRWMMLNRTDHYWVSTRTTAWILAALADYVAAERATSGPAGRPRGGSARAAAGAPLTEVTVRLNGQTLRTYRFAPDLRGGQDVVLATPASALRQGSNALTIEHTGGAGRVFYTVHLRQVVAATDLPALHPEGLRVAREYLRVSMRRSGEGWALQAEPADNRLAQGDRVLVRLTITAPRDLAYVIVEDPVPAGFEITERGSAEIDEWGYWWNSTDVRDDRIVFFARSLPAGRHVIEYHLRAQTPGAYQALPTVLQGMYAPQVRAESAGVRVVIR